MSAFVVISLIEAVKSSSASRFPSLNSVLSKAIRYLEGQLPQINDAYSLSITCYALSKYGSQYRHSCFGKLQNSMISQEGMIYWTENNRRGSTSAERAPAKDIEATAYVLLTYIAIGRHSDALPIVKWLASQRNAQGGFATTQDTVMSVQALTEYSLQLSRSNPNPIRAVQIEAAGVGLSHTYAISNTNYNVTHRFTIPASVPLINVAISGNGLAVFDVVETFYVSKSQDHPDISVNVTLVRESINSLTIRPVLSWKGVSTSNLLMMEIEMPTGFGADLEFVKRQFAIRRHESNGQTFILYFNSLAPRQSVQVEVKMDRVDPVVGNQACHVTVYDYYEPEKQSVTTYESGVLKRANICNVCPLCSWCTQSNVPTFGRK